MKKIEGKKIRLLCAGLGGMGRHDWSTAAQVSDFELVAGVDVVPEAKAAFKKETGAPVFDDFAETLAGVPADAALIAAPDRFHAPYSIAALEAGLDVICEKPMAETLDDARRMHQAAVDNGRLLMIHHQLRWTPVYNHAHRLVHEGAIGQVREIEFRMSVFSNVCSEGYRKELPQLMLQDLGIHHFDMMRFLSGEDATRVYVKSWTSNENGLETIATTAVHAILEMTGPVNASYTSTMRALMDPTGYGCAAVITGSKGVLKINDEGLTLQTFERFAAKKDPQQIRPEPPELGVMAAFAEAIKTREPALTDSSDNLKSIELLFAAIESVETGQPVSV